MNKTFVASIALAAMLSGNAKELPITNWRVSEPISVRTPFMNDSIAPDGSKFKTTDILKSHTRVQMPGATVATDSTGVIALKAAPEANGAMQILQTLLRSERFAKGQLKVTSQLPFIVELNGSELTSKLSAEKDSVAGFSTASAALRLEPEHDVRLTIKLLAMAADSVTSPDVKVVFTPDDKFTNTVISSGPDMLRRFALEDSEYGNRVSGLSMSPDGKYIIMRYWNRYDGQRYRTWAELVDLKSGKVVNANLPWGVNWMPNGSSLYMTQTAADGFDLFSVDPVSGATTLLAESIPVDKFTWSPKGDCLYYTHTEQGVKETGPLRRYATPDDRMPGDRTRAFIVRFTPATGISERLTFGNHSTTLNDISRDGSKLLLSTSQEDPTTRPFYRNSFYTLDVETLKADTLISLEPMFVNSGIFSPDGKQVLFSGSPSAFNELGKNCGSHPIANDFDIQLYIMDIASKSVKPVTRDFDPAVGNIISWNAADGKIYFIGEQGFNNNLYVLDPKSDKIEQLPADVENITTATMGDDQSLRVAYMGHGYHYAWRACLLDLKKDKNSILADPRAEDLAKIDLNKVETWTFTASDGTEIDGIVCYPPNFDPSKKYPLIVYYYGGTSPTAKSITQPYTPQLFASRDYVVYVVNPSGTTGYGQEFSARHVNAWGKRTAQDIIEGVQKFYRTHEYVDSTKIGCLGASYGGFMTQYLQTQTPIFAAAVSHAGISNVTSYWGEGYWGYSYNGVAAADSYPWSNPELYTKQGSLFNADKINTPLLLLHGTADTNVPIGESIQLFNALRILGKPVEFISVDGENHFISDFPKRILWQNSIMAWFEKWLKEDSSWWDDLYPARNL
ncbi:MAG: prolyl oligopeptidase family serine peptidase [Bacteroides sp.]|nr:prolyl oligopeptidase family serine peptidase [Bacteroides sp.]MCM1379500.1 prolyl oligopeptidase family serine peptidase [Bacteroides sp.]MCM1445897.1 prolyl oligopeptidase family serine peptidase [Prevotella sp.]